MTTLPGSGPHPTILTAGLSILVALLALGCVTPVVRTSAPVAYAVVYDDGDAYAYDTYPSYVYNGRTVFLVGDRWYFQGDRGWAYYSNEPPGLWAYRRDYYGSYGYARTPRYGAPPAYRGRFTAPPARPNRAPAYAPDARRRQPSAPYSHGPGTVPAPRARPYPGQSPMQGPRQPSDAPRRAPGPQQYRPAPGQQQQQQPQQKPNNNNNQKKRDNGKPVRGGAA